MEKLIRSGKWFRIKKDGIKYWCRITYDFKTTHERATIRIEKHFWFKDSFIGELQVYGKLHTFKAGENWYSIETAKELFEKAHKHITLNNARREHLKIKRSKISHLRNIE